MTAPATPTTPTTATPAADGTRDTASTRGTATHSTGMARHWRLTIATVAALALAGPFVYSSFAAFIVASGCFIGCSDPEPVLGLGIAMIPTAILSGWSALLAWAIGRGDRMLSVAGWTAAVTAGIAVVLVAAAATS